MSVQPPAPHHRAHWCSHTLHIAGLFALSAALGAIAAALAHSKSSTTVDGYFQNYQVLSETAFNWHVGILVVMVVASGVFLPWTSISACFGKRSVPHKPVPLNADHPKAKSESASLQRQLQRRTGLFAALGCFAIAYVATCSTLLCAMRYQSFRLAPTIYGIIDTDRIATIYRVCIPLAVAGFGALCGGYCCHKALARRQAHAG
jgi:hypothetical protein